MGGSSKPPKPPKINIPKPQIVKDLGNVIEKNTKDVSAGIESIKKEGPKATNQISQEAGKLASGNFNLKQAVAGSLKGAETTFKKSDLGVKAQELQQWGKERLFGSDEGEGKKQVATKTTMGSSATMGEGGKQGMKMGDQMKSGQQMAKQNKRKLRISKKTVKV